MWIVLSDHDRYLNHIRYTVPETDNHHGGTSQNHLCLLYDRTWGRPPYWFSTNVYISGADYG